MGKIKQYIISQLIGIVLGQISPDMFKRLGDQILDLIENIVEETETRVDDAVVLPICHTIRVAFGIPDGDDE
jgi:hypothetical protein